MKKVGLVLVRDLFNDQEGATYDLEEEMEDVLNWER